MLRRLFLLLAALSAVLCIATSALWIRSHWTADFYSFDNGQQLVSAGGGVEWEQGMLLSPNNTHHKYVYATESPPREDFGRFAWYSYMSPAFSSTTAPAPVTVTPSRRTFDADGNAVGTVNGGYGGSIPGGFSETLTIPAGMFDSKSLTIPYWSIAFATAILPALAVLLRRKRHGAGHCVKCGYDLRATLDRCPECGRVPKKVSRAAPNP